MHHPHLHGKILEPFQMAQCHQLLDVDVVIWLEKENDWACLTERQKRHGDSPSVSVRQWRAWLCAAG